MKRVFRGWRPLFHGFVIVVRLVALLPLGLFALSASAAGSVYVNGQDAALVLGQPNFTSNTQATTANGMKVPNGIVFDPVSGKVFVGDTYNHRVLRFASGAALVNGAAAEAVLGQTNFTSNAAATTATGMNAPSALTIDSAGRLWVTDFLNHRVLRFDNAASKANGAAANGVLGQPNFTSSNVGTTANGLNGPVGVLADSAGRLWVADFYNHRVLRFDNAAGKANGAAADAVLGQPDFTSNVAATTASGMKNPSNVDFDSAGRLWVADTQNNRVLRFDAATSKANGAAADGVLGQPDFTSSSQNTTASTFRFPADVQSDASGSVWVSDQSNNRVLRFDNAASKANGAAADGVLGQSDFTSSPSMTAASTLNLPIGVSIDLVGNLWVVDSFNNRVLRYEPPVVWANPTAITYGTALSATQLNATDSVPGTFIYTPAAGTVLGVGNGQTLSVTFVPNDPANYSTVTKTVVINVTQAPQTITFGALANKTTTDAPFTVNATGGASGNPVTFTSTTPSVCTVSGNTVTIAGAGTCTVAADQAGDANYQAAPQVTQSFAVNQLPQTITFGALANKQTTDAPFTVNATGGASGNPVTFTSTTPSVCTVSGSTVTIAGAGTCTIAADQAGDTNYQAAPQVTQSFVVTTPNAAPVAQTITFNPLPNKMVADAPFTVSATASSNLPVAFSSTTPTVCTVSGSTVTLLAAGTCMIAADQAGDTSFQAAPQATQSFEVLAPVGNGDSDGDGIPDSAECPNPTSCPDTDGDGIPNYLDLDSDGDNIPDSVECPNPAACTDSDGDTVPDYLEPNNADTDGDGIPNNLDADDDGDGVPTKNEQPGSGLTPKDTDGDGIPNYLDKDGTSTRTDGGDSDGDGISDKAECPNGVPCPDTDGDGIPNYMDTDSDGDGILDNVECPNPTACTDSDGDTVPDYLEPNNGDTDGDGTPNYLDTDDDGDGILTKDEQPGGGLTPVDTDKDGIPDYLDGDNSGSGNYYLPIIRSNMND